jgi:hypothetical protein
LKKYCLLLLLLHLITFNTRAQENPETITKKDWLTDGVREKYSVLKSDGQTREGLYEAIYSPTGAVIAKGNYTDGKKTGTWQFLDIYQRIVEVFDYTRVKLLGEEPVDRLSRQYIQYAFDVKPRDTDRLTKPIRIGGRCFGYIPYLQIFKLSRAYNDVDSRQLSAHIELLISPGGRLADLKVHIVTPDGYDNVTSFSPDIFSEEDKQFVPATFNGKPIMSRIFLACRVTDAGTLDVD